MYQKTNERKKQAILVKEQEEMIEEKHVPYCGADEAMRYIQLVLCEQFKSFVGHT